MNKKSPSTYNGYIEECDNRIEDDGRLYKGLFLHVIIPNSSVKKDSQYLGIKFPPPEKFLRVEITSGIQTGDRL
jgi:hypothetical protein